jgi:hypothetical protein
MPDELRFTDPAFSCEVFLRGISKALYEAADDQFNRLREIRNLGLIGHFDDTAFHTKHHHFIGLSRLFEKLLLQPKAYGLPKKFLWSFWPRLCFGQSGHAAFAYDAEKAVLLACQVDTTFRQSFNDFLEPVVQEARKYVSEEDDAHKENLVRGWFEHMIDNNIWRKVYLWVAALKLIQNSKLISILSGQIYDETSGSPGFDFSTAFNILIDHQCEWINCCERMNRLDYVVRDLNFGGRLGVTLDVDRLVAGANNDEDPDWRLIQSLDFYLTETLYTSFQRQTEAVIFQRTLAELLIKRKVSLEMLFGIDPNNYLTDDDLKEIICRVSQGKELFNPLYRKDWQTWCIRAAVDRHNPPYQLEQKLAGKRKATAILSEPSKKRIISYQLYRPTDAPLLGFAIRHRDTADRPDVGDFLQACVRMLSVMYPRINMDDVFKALCEGLCGQQIRYGLDKAAQFLSKVDFPDKKLLQKASRFLNRSIKYESSSNQELRLVIAGLEQPIESADIGLPLRLMNAVIMSGGKKQNILGTTFEDAMQIFWNHLMFWQTRFFSGKPAKIIKDVILTVQQLLKARILNDDETKARDLEIYTLLESMINPAEGIKVRFFFPNFEVLKDDNNKENEYDVVSILQKANKSIEVWIWGATTGSNIGAKRRDDTEKIQRLKDLLGRRWSPEIRAIQNYVHIDRNAICLEVDGRQEQRN